MACGPAARITCPNRHARTEDSPPFCRSVGKSHASPSVSTRAALVCFLRRNATSAGRTSRSTDCRAKALNRLGVRPGRWASSTRSGRCRPKPTRVATANASQALKLCPMKRNENGKRLRLEPTLLSLGPHQIMGRLGRLAGVRLDICTRIRACVEPTPITEMLQPPLAPGVCESGHVREHAQSQVLSMTGGDATSASSGPWAKSLQKCSANQRGNGVSQSMPPVTSYFVCL